MGWVEHHNDDNWDGDAHTTWDAGESRWDIDGDGVGTLVVDGEWFTDYRPTKMRVTFSGPGSQEVYLYDSEDNLIASDESYSSADEVSITFGVLDIGTLVIQYLNLQYISNIEFYEAPAAGGTVGKFIGVANASIAAAIGVAKASIAKILTKDIS